MENTTNMRWNGMGVDMTTRGHSEDVVRTEPGITALKAWLYAAVGVM